MSSQQNLFPDGFPHDVILHIATMTSPDDVETIRSFSDCADVMQNEYLVNFCINFGRMHYTLHMVSIKAALEMAKLIWKGGDTDILQAFLSMSKNLSEEFRKESQRAIDNGDFWLEITNVEDQPHLKTDPYQRYRRVMSLLSGGHVLRQNVFDRVLVHDLSQHNRYGLALYADEELFTPETMKNIRNMVSYTCYLPLWNDGKIFEYSPVVYTTTSETQTLACEEIALVNYIGSQYAKSNIRITEPEN